MELDERVGRGIRANEVLQNEIYQESFDMLKREILTKWQESPARDTEGREKLYTMLGLLEKLKGLMEMTLMDGKVASKELEHKRTMLERSKAYLSDIL